MRVIVIASGVTVGINPEGDNTLEETWTIHGANIDIEGGDTSYDFLKMIIDDTLQMVQTADGTDVWYGDNFLYNQDLRLNRVASIFADVRLHGPVVLARTDDMGNTIGFTPEQFEATMSRLREIVELIEAAQEMSL